MKRINFKNSVIALAIGMVAMFSGCDNKDGNGDENGNNSGTLNCTNNEYMQKVPPPPFMIDKCNEMKSLNTFQAVFANATHDGTYTYIAQLKSAGYTVNEDISTGGADYRPDGGKDYRWLHWSAKNADGWLVVVTFDANPAREEDIPGMAITKPSN
jgi:hypothetical protein